MDTGASQYKQGDSASPPPRATLTAAPHPEVLAHSPQAMKGGGAPPLPTSGMLFAYRRSWDLFPLAVLQARPVLMLSR